MLIYYVNLPLMRALFKWIRAMEVLRSIRKFHSLKVLL